MQAVNRGTRKELCFFGTLNIYKAQIPKTGVLIASNVYDFTVYLF
jgi:hypothetical protein